MKSFVNVQTAQTELKLVPELHSAMQFSRTGVIISYIRKIITKDDLFDKLLLLYVKTSVLKEYCDSLGNLLVHFLAKI